jgi:hypothetical protein
MRGVRVEGDTVIISVTGGNDAARWLCRELVAMIETERQLRELERDFPGSLGSSLQPPKENQRG